MTNYLIIVGVIILAYFLIKSFGSGGSKHFENLNATDAKKLLKGKDVVLLDVSMPSEIKQGKIKGAKELNISSANFTSGLKNLDHSKTYIVYCRSGNRSRKACNVMGANGFEKLYNLQGGYMNW